MATPPQFPPEVYGIFCGGVEQTTAQKVVNSLSVAMNPTTGVKHVHLIFQSTGGVPGDGVFLYNLFRAVPIELTLYNVGQLSSAGVIAYLGAKRRKTSARATFMLHRTTNSPQFATSERLQSIAKSLVLDDDRLQSIITEHVKLPDDLWKEMQYHDVFLSGEEAVRFGLATEIGEFEPPAGTHVFNVLA